MAPISRTHPGVQEFSTRHVLSVALGAPGLRPSDEILLAAGGYQKPVTPDKARKWLLENPELKVVNKRFQKWKQLVATLPPGEQEIAHRRWVAQQLPLFGAKTYLQVAIPENIAKCEETLAVIFNNPQLLRDDLAASQKILFQGNTILDRYSDGAIKSGILAQKYSCQWNGNAIDFRAGTPIEFHPNGMPKRGIVDGSCNSRIHLFGCIGATSFSDITLMEGTEVVFDERGRPLRATPFSDTFVSFHSSEKRRASLLFHAGHVLNFTYKPIDVLRYSHWERRTCHTKESLLTVTGFLNENQSLCSIHDPVFASGTPVSVSADAEFISGILAHDFHVKSRAGNQNREWVFPQGTRFTYKGEFVRGTLSGYASDLITGGKLCICPPQKPFTLSRDTNQTPIKTDDPRDRFGTITHSPFQFVYDAEGDILVGLKDDGYGTLSKGSPVTLNSYGSFSGALPRLSPNQVLQRDLRWGDWVFQEGSVLRAYPDGSPFSGVTRHTADVNIGHDLQLTLMSGSRVEFHKGLVKGADRIQSGSLRYYGNMPPYLTKVSSNYAKSEVILK